MKNFLGIFLISSLACMIMGQNTCRKHVSILNNTNLSLSSMVEIQYKNQTHLAILDSQLNVTLLNISSLNASLNFSSGHSKRVNSMAAVGENLQYLATASDDSTVLVRDLNGSKLLLNFTNHSTAVKSVVKISNYNAVYKNLSLVASADESGKIFVWDIFTGKIVDSIQENRTVYTLLNSDDNLLYTFSGGLKTYNLYNMTCLLNVSLFASGYIPDSIITGEFSAIIVTSSSSNLIFRIGSTGITRNWSLIDSVVPNGVVNSYSNSYILHSSGGISFFTWLSRRAPEFRFNTTSNKPTGPILYTSNKLLALDSKGFDSFDFSGDSDPIGYNGTCLKSCPNGTYTYRDSYFNDFCIPCDSRCKTCFDSSYTSCTSCQDNFFLNKFSCLSKCPLNSHNISNNTCQCNNGFYPDTSGTCYDCENLNCKGSCDLKGVCSSCDYGYYLTSTGVCNSCPYGCSSCSSATVCDVCKYNYELVGTSCLQRCYSGQYRTASGYCASCYYRCESCYDGYNGACQSCSSDIYDFDNGFCEIADHTLTIVLAVVCPIVGTVLIVFLVALCIKMKRDRDRARNTALLNNQANPDVINNSHQQPTQAGLPHQAAGPHQGTVSPPNQGYQAPNRVGGQANNFAVVGQVPVMGAPIQQIQPAFYYDENGNKVLLYQAQQNFYANTNQQQGAHVQPNFNNTTQNPNLAHAENQGNIFGQPPQFGHPNGQFGHPNNAFGQNQPGLYPNLNNFNQATPDDPSLNAPLLNAKEK